MGLVYSPMMFSTEGVLFSRPKITTDRVLAKAMRFPDGHAVITPRSQTCTPAL